MIRLFFILFLISSNAFAYKIHCWGGRNAHPQVKSFQIESMEHYQTRGAFLTNFQAPQIDIQNKGSETYLSFSNAQDDSFLLIFRTNNLRDIFETQRTKILGVLKYQFLETDRYSGEQNLQEGLVRVTCHKFIW